MSLVKKIKDILFEEEDYTEQINIPKEVKKEEPKIVKIESFKDEEKVQVNEPSIKFTSEVPKVQNAVSEREIFKQDNSFQFPDFDEEEFTSNIQKPKQRTNVLEYERKKSSTTRTDYGRYEKIETKEYTEKKKFKPSPIISPVYGILNQDYKAEDIIDRTDSASNIDIDTVRKKAFESIIVEKKEHKIENPIETIDEPVVTFFEEKDSVKVEEEPKNNYKSIDNLLEEASDEIALEDTLEIPKTNNLDAIEEELEKLDLEEKDNKKDLDDTLDSDLFELIDSMYDDREEAE